MSDIKTWIERCDEHPDHQSGMISDGMIRARMCEEIADLRAENERLRAAARNALNELNCIEEDGGHRCIRGDSEIDEGHHVRLALRNALEGKP